MTAPRPWRCARRGGYAAILMDMQMPNINGLDATRQIRAIDGYRELPIIALTGPTPLSRTGCADRSRHERRPDQAGESACPSPCCWRGLMKAARASPQSFGGWR